MSIKQIVIGIKTGIALLAFPLLFSVACTGDERPAGDQSKLVAAMGHDTPGYFHFNGNDFGFQYELLSEYAAHTGRELTMASEGSMAGHARMLSRRKADMAVMVNHCVQDESTVSVPIYNTGYAVLATRKEAREINRIADEDKNIYRIVGDGIIQITQGFAETASYDILLDSLRGINAYLSSRDIFELIENLSAGKSDFLICEETEAHLATALVKNISIVYEFNESVPVCILFDAADSLEAARFSAWLDEFRSTAEYETLNDLYFEKGIAGELMSRGLKNRGSGEISAYDNIFRRIGEEENIDWRFLAAISYVESKFNRYIVSHVGARGLMQVMPIVADEFGVSRDSIMVPETNVRLAAKLIKRFSKLLSVSEEVDFENRMSIMLGCYNGGLGHIADARRLAQKNGADPDSWDEVSLYLTLKSEEGYIEDEAVRNGSFTGARTTIAFVSKVMDKYDSYRSRVVR